LGEILTFLLDSGCLIAAQTPGEQFHAAAAKLIEAGAAGLVHLTTATSVEYDLEAADAERAELRRDWLAERPFIRRVPGPFILDISRLDWGDVLVDDADADTLGKVRDILVTTPPPGGPDDRWRRNQIDYHHVAAASLAGADAIVTTDKKDLLRRREKIRDACRVDVIDPQEAVSRITS
jgi:predicted nucleic acid-binding protein